MDTENKADMLIELPDKRLVRIMPEEEFQSLKTRAEEAYAKIVRDSDEKVLINVLDLLLVMREVELRLLEDRFRDTYLAAYGSKASLA